VGKSKSYESRNSNERGRKETKKERTVRRPQIRYERRHYESRKSKNQKKRRVVEGAFFCYVELGQGGGISAAELGDTRRLEGGSKKKGVGPEKDC